MITVKVMHPDAGYDSDKERVKKLTLNIHYTVECISMGQSYTSLLLAEVEGNFNSVNFDFYEDNEPIDIFADRRFNPYLH